MTRKYSVEEELCTSCGQCSSDCPTNAIGPVEYEKYRINQKRCIGCGHCGALCPANAIKFNGQELEPWEDPGLDPEKLLQFIVGKRSMRNYQEKDIPADVIDKILYAGSMTATATNNQDWEAHIYNGRKKEELIRIASKSMCRRLKKINTPLGRQIAKAGGFSRYANRDFLGKAIEAYSRGISGEKDPFFFNAPCVIIITSPKKRKNMARANAVMAGTHMMLYANSLGIGSCFIGLLDIAVSKYKKVKEEIGIGPDRSIATVFTLGYSNQKYLRLPVRKSIHTGKSK